MSVVSALLEIANAAASVTALVAARQYSEQAPQSPTLPYASFYVISQENLIQTSGGLSGSIANVQLSIVTQTAASRAAVVAAYKDLFHGYRGVAQTANVRIQSCVFSGPVHTHDEPRDGSSTGLYEAACDLQVWFN